MELKKVAILGAGTMGRGIAQWFAQIGVQVELGDAFPEAASKSRELIHESWDKLEKKGKFSSEQVKQFKASLYVTGIEEYSKDSDLLIEAIIEDPKIKREVFQKFDYYFNKETIFASNTSSIPINSMAKELSGDRKKRFLGLHFFNPATIMKLVEIIESHWSDKVLAQDLKEWFKNNNKKPALCVDSPGFIVNRVARNFYGEAFRIAGHEDQEKFKEIDSVLKEVGGFKMGPYELMDLIGIDINYSVTQSVWEAFYHDPRFAPHAIQRNMVDSGRLGKKSKEGFYKYE